MNLASASLTCCRWEVGGIDAPPILKLKRPKRSDADASDISCATALRTGSSRPAPMPSSSRMMRNSRVPPVAGAIAAFVANGAGRVDAAAAGAVAGAAPAEAAVTSSSPLTSRCLPSVLIDSSSRYKSAIGPSGPIARTMNREPAAGAWAGLLAEAALMVTANAVQPQNNREEEIRTRMGVTSAAVVWTASPAV